MSERRKSTMRRQFNDAFSAPDGSFSITKVIAVFAQIAVLYHMGKNFDSLIDRPESLAIVLTVLILPDIAKKIITMKLGVSDAKSRKVEGMVRQGEAAG